MELTGNVIIDKDNVLLKKDFIKTMFQLKKGDTVILVCKNEIPYEVAEEVRKVFVDMGIRHIITSESRVFDVKTPDQFWIENYPIKELNNWTAIAHSIFNFAVPTIGTLLILISSIKLAFIIANI